MLHHAVQTGPDAAVHREIDQTTLLADEVVGRLHARRLDSHLREL